MKRRRESICLSLLLSFTHIFSILINDDNNMLSERKRRGNREMMREKYIYSLYTCSNMPYQGYLSLVTRECTPLTTITLPFSCHVMLNASSP